MNERLRIALYNYFYERFSEEWEPPELPLVEPEVAEALRKLEGIGRRVARKVWSEFWHRPLDKFPRKESFLRILRDNIVERHRCIV